MSNPIDKKVAETSRYAVDDLNRVLFAVAPEMFNIHSNATMLDAPENLRFFLTLSEAEQYRDELEAALAVKKGHSPKGAEPSAKADADTAATSAKPRKRAPKASVAQAA